jgi:hypothetical protein
METETDEDEDEGDELEPMDSLAGCHLRHSAAGCITLGHIAQCTSQARDH